MNFSYLVNIEIPKGDDRRRHLNYAGTAIEDFGPIKEVIPVNGGVMPVAYGYLDDTLNKEEGDNVDVLIFSNKNFVVGEKVKVIPIGLIVRADKDHKVLAVDDTVSYQKWEDVPLAERNLILEYFGYKHKIEEVADSLEAVKCIEQSKI